MDFLGKKAGRVMIEEKTINIYFYTPYIQRKMGSSDGNSAGSKPSKGTERAYAGR